LLKVCIFVVLHVLSLSPFRHVLRTASKDKMIVLASLSVGMLFCFLFRFSKLRKFHSLPYSDLGQESNLITLLFGFVLYVLYYTLLLR
jgi:hypothetical protein